MTAGKIRLLGLCIILIGAFTLTFSTDATAFVSTLVIGIPALLTKNF